ncbi:MAG: DUF72 domain-containing protein [Vicinamibacterales bacterium]
MRKTANSRGLGAVYVGTSGWSYPTGPGTWNGIVYPKPRPKGFDELEHYARFFDTTEINNTFYRPPDPKIAETWVRRTPPHFVFSVKLHQRFTHPAMHKKATGDREVRRSQADVDEFRRGLDPLATAGKLGALLVQFPASFTASAENQDYLTWLFAAFKGYELALELRHRTWSDDAESLLQLLREHHAAWVQIDEPRFRTSIRQDYLPNVSFYYLRLHGRRADKWWHHGHRDERYDYLYTAEELRSFAEILSAIRRLTKKSYAYMNNHPAGQSAANALQLKHGMKQGVPDNLPLALLARYPELAAILPAAAPAADKEPFRLTPEHVAVKAPDRER